MGDANAPSFEIFKLLPSEAIGFCQNQCLLFSRCLAAGSSAAESLCAVTTMRKSQ